MKHSLKVVVVLSIIFISLIAGCGGNAPVENKVNPESSEGTSQPPLQQESPAGEYRERREWRRDGQNSITYDYIYKKGETGDFLSQRVELKEPISHKDAELLAREIFPKNQRGKLLSVESGDIGYPGATGYKEEYERCEITYRKREGLIGSIHFHSF
jgi:hypothetical protein